MLGCHGIPLSQVCWARVFGDGVTEGTLSDTLAPSQSTSGCIDKHETSVR